MRASYERSDRSATVPAPLSVDRLERARLGRRIGLGVIALLVVLGLFNRLGPLQHRVSASQQGQRLTVSYPAVSRAGLPASWIVEVERQGGWEGQITLAVTHEYFEQFDFHNLSPEPSSVSADGDLLVLEFDPPEGDLLTVRFDGRVEPGIQMSREATTTLMRADQTIAEVRYRSWLVP